ncbi:MAG: ATP-binding protein [Candidatus Zixiibacteriota bacterium]|jgi:MinD superfamily P-loop ATPase
MKELVILSGKGGTGKTSLTASLAVLAAPVVVADADVDAPDLHILLGPEVKSKREFRAGFDVSIRHDDCTECGRCIELCRFDAINRDYDVDMAACEGCGVCVDLCPVGAVDMREKAAGEWYLSDTRVGPMAHALLSPGEENSGKLVAVVRKAGQTLAHRDKMPLVLVDGPPGVGCPVISALSGASAALIVAEPTPTGLQGFSRAADLARHFGVPAWAAVNKYDLSPENTALIEREAAERDMPLVGRIPYDRAVTAAQRERRAVVEYDGAGSGGAAPAIREVWEKINTLL